MLVFSQDGSNFDENGKKIPFKHIFVYYFRSATVKGIISKSAVLLFTWCIDSSFRISKITCNVFRHDRCMLTHLKQITFENIFLHDKNLSVCASFPFTTMFSTIFNTYTYIKRLFLCLPVCFSNP